MPRRLGLALLIASGLAFAAPARADVLILGYKTGYGVSAPNSDNPPAEYARLFEVLRQTGLEIRWEPAPPERRVETLKSGATNFCLPGVFKTAERTAIAVFSEPYETPAPYVVLSLASKAAEIQRHATIGVLLADSRLIFLRFGGVSYGEALDAMIRDAAGHVEVVFSDTADPAGMLLTGRADYALTRQAVAIRAIETAGYSVQSFAFTTMSDLPAEPIYFMCNKAIAPNLLNRLNQAIRVLRQRPVQD
jgi:polar amino acid transport system substrate-binding protein